MSTLNYQAYSTPASGKEMLQNIAAKASAWGWTLGEDKTGADYGWVQTTGWSLAAGDQRFLQLENGTISEHSQQLCYRFVVDNDATYDDILKVSGIPYADKTYDINDAYDPCEQDHYNGRNTQGSADFRSASIPDSSFNNMWIFGDEKFIAVVCQVDSDHVYSFAFGLPELIPEFKSRSDLMGVWIGGSTYQYKWSDMDSSPTQFWPFCSPEHETAANGYDRYIYWDSAGRTHTDDYLHNFYLHNDQPVYDSMHWSSTPGEGLGMRMELGMRMISYNNFRMVQKPAMFIRDTASSKFYMFGTLPVYHFPYSGLTIGEEVDWGGSTYIVFPIQKQGVSDWGFGFKVS